MNLKTLTLGIAATGLVLLASCAKENKVAREMDGTWNMAYQWGGTPTKNAGSEDEAGTWTLTKCKSSKIACQGSYTGDLGDDTSFTWQILAEGDSIEFENTDNTHVQELFEGKWEIFSRTDSKVLMTSTDCDGCFGLGPMTITLTPTE